MREIKFRAWDWKKMSNLFDLWDLSYEWFPNMCLDDSWEEIMPHIIFMQYTWLKDKNGKEIYEGDIVKGGWNYIWEVIYDEDFLQFRFKNDRELDYYGLNKLEIIWNIYENPDLLNNK